jgi:hypothetical protein
MRAPATLTEAQLLSRVQLIDTGGNSTSSTSRTIPYAERYRAATGILETPAEQFQQAARDEQKRKLTNG